MIQVGKDSWGRPRYAIDERGQRPGKLLVIKRAPRIGAAIAWWCRCDCGRIIKVRGVMLRMRTKSCGCTRIHPLPHGQAPLNRAYDRVSSMAIRHGHAWNITKAQFKSHVIQNCHYCGTEPQYLIENKYGNFRFSGLDRIDSSKEYTNKNVVACCSTCNRMKGNMSQARFFEICQTIVNRYNLSLRKADQVKL
jgi:hypothetical protein